MICKNALYTKSKLREWGMISDDSCVLCGLQTETIDHLFFLCGFSNSLWGKILQMVSIYKTVGSYDQEIFWFLNHLSAKNFKTSIVKMLFSATGYHIWIERNNRVFIGKRQSQGQILNSALTEVSLASMVWRNVNRSYENWDLCLSLGLSEAVFHPSLPAGARGG
uniref:Reverse transcriptase zinc-binding domain-containing protein n=1 Tax=Davidia involucrata TaxID=16924 RepID=A0A5B7BH22_DAVIN